MRIAGDIMVSPVAALLQATKTTGSSLQQRASRLGPTGALDLLEQWRTDGNLIQRTAIRTREQLCLSHSLMVKGLGKLQRSTKAALPPSPMVHPTVAAVDGSGVSPFRLAVAERLNGTGLPVAFPRSASKGGASSSGTTQRQRLRAVA
nr:hypothetical protein Iba_chr12aCG10160 [Ipomoea batatas]